MRSEILRALAYIRGEGYTVTSNKRRKLYSTEVERVYRVQQGTFDDTMTTDELLKFARRRVDGDAGKMKITIEGPQGCGKTRLADRLSSLLLEMGYAVDRRQDGSAIGGSLHETPRQRVLINEVQS